MTRCRRGRAGRGRRRRTTAASSAARGTTRTRCCGSPRGRPGSRRRRQGGRRKRRAEPARQAPAGRARPAGSGVAGGPRREVWALPDAHPAAGTTYGLGRLPRVVTKTRFHLNGRAGGGGGGGSRRGQPLREHLVYLARPEAQVRPEDGRDEAEREGGRQAKPPAEGVFFDAQQDAIDAAPLPQKWKLDRHHWRVIVSPQEGAELDLKAFTRDLANRLEEHFGTRLEWAAVVHVNTPHPHVHLLIRGLRDDGRDLRMTRDDVAEHLGTAGRGRAGGAAGAEGRGRGGRGPAGRGEAEAADGPRRSARRDRPAAAGRRGGRQAVQAAGVVGARGVRSAPPPAAAGDAGTARPGVARGAEPHELGRRDVVDASAGVAGNAGPTRRFAAGEGAGGEAEGAAGTASEEGRECPR